jgi:transcriptional regulator with XRE-family HTH domain
MAKIGRPVERPVHLTSQQRRRAQAQTSEWRRISGLSQKEMAEKVAVGESTYRMWETGTGDHAGPTRQQTQLLNKALLLLLGERYSDGLAFEIWGWPAERALSFIEFASMMQSAGLMAQHLQADPPSAVLWAQRLREPNLVHGVLALAAAAATRTGLSVRLLLDDADMSLRTRQVLRDEFDFSLRRWFDFATGDKSLLTVNLYSDILTDQLLEQRGWATVRSFLNAKCSVLEFLIASKAVSPLQYNINADQSVLELVRQVESLRADRLITPIRKWIIFEHEVADLAGKRLTDRASIVTLGGEDERVLWELWHRGSTEELSARVQHMYLRPVPMPSYRVPWQEPALTAKTSRPWLTTYLRNRMDQDGDTDLLEWILRAAVNLPAALNADFRTRLPAILADPGALFGAPPDQLAQAIPATADAVVRWLTA